MKGDEYNCPYCDALNVEYDDNEYQDSELLIEKWYCPNCHQMFKKVYKIEFTHFKNEMDEVIEYEGD